MDCQKCTKGRVNRPQCPMLWRPHHAVAVCAHACTSSSVPLEQALYCCLTSALPHPRVADPEKKGGGDQKGGRAMPPHTLSPAQSKPRKWFQTHRKAWLTVRLHMQAVCKLPLQPAFFPGSNQVPAIVLLLLTVFVVCASAVAASLNLRGNR